jgi:hypothetical protein
MATVLRRLSPVVMLDETAGDVQPLRSSPWSRMPGRSRGAPEDLRADGKRGALARDRGRPGRRDD